MIARVFPRRTKATPSDPLAFVGPPPLFLPAGISFAKLWARPASIASLLRLGRKDIPNEQKPPSPGQHEEPDFS